MQRARVKSYVSGTMLLVAVSLVWMTVGWMPAVVGITWLVLIPFALLGIVADRHLLKYQRQRLAECERRLDESAQ